MRAIVPGFDQLSETTARRIVASARERSYAPRDTLYRSGDAADGLYFVLAGRVRVSRETDTGAQLLHSESAGGILGEIPVFGGGSFPASAVATEPTRCAHLPCDAVQRLLRDEAEFARFALRRLALRARSLLRRIDELTTTTITSRVAGHILDRVAGSPSVEFTLGMSQEALAGELGTAREVIVRALGALVEAGAIVRAGRSRYSVGRLSTLRAIASR